MTVAKVEEEQQMAKPRKRYERDVQALIHRTGEKTSNTLHRHPVLTVAGASGLALATASVLGAGPTIVAGGAAYLAYRWLKRSPGALYQQRESAA